MAAVGRITALSLSHFRSLSLSHTHTHTHTPPTTASLPPLHDSELHRTFWSEGFILSRFERKLPLQNDGLLEYIV
jgi:hypothetical protein